MLPYRAPRYDRYERSANAETLGEDAKRYSRFALLAQHADIFDGKFRATLTFAVWLSLFAVAIGNVICLTAQEQMRGANAIPHVAMVTDEYTGRDCTICQFPRETMDPIWLPVKLYLAVSAFVVIPAPSPARIGRSAAIQVRPKARSNVAITHKMTGETGARSTAVPFTATIRMEGAATVGADEAILAAHDEPPIRCAVPGVVAATPRLLYV